MYENGAGLPTPKSGSLHVTQCVLTNGVLPAGNQGPCDRTPTVLGASVPV